MSLEDDARAELARLAAANRLRTPRVVDGRQGATIELDGQLVVNFGSNDYLGLAGDVRLARAAAEHLDCVGVGAGASRLLVGNQRAHVALESALADWLRVGGVRVFATGYAANLGVITTLLGAGDVVFSDELNHASIVDGCRLSRAAIEVYPHRDLAALERLLESRTGRRRAVVSESLFSMDGDLADVVALSELCRRHDAALILDEAHAIGARGPEGRGIAASVGVVPDVLVGTCGKALGTFGAFVATSAAVAELLWNRARPLVFSTAAPALVQAATVAAIEIARSSEGDERRSTLAGNARRLRELVPRAGGGADSAIVPVCVGDDHAALELSRRLLAAGLLVPAIRPPTVPEGTSRLRLSLTAAHRNEHVETVGSHLMTHRVIEGGHGPR